MNHCVQPNESRSNESRSKESQEKSVDEIVCYTDGSSWNSGSSCASAVVVQCDGSIVEKVNLLGKGTNNIAELYAILLALDTIEELNVSVDRPIQIRSDSTYAIGVLTESMTGHANKELIQLIKQKLKKYKNIEIQWVPGHSKIEGNERADILCKLARYMGTKPIQISEIDWRQRLVK